jgi:hypothetical protein
MSKLILSHDDACDIVCQDHQDFVDIPNTKEIIDQSRWGNLLY